MTRKIILLMVFCFFLISTCFAETSKEKTDDQYFVIVNQTKIYAKNLVVTDGEGAYDGYLKMSGYPRDDKFQIYFQDTSDDNFTSMHVTYQDLRGIDLNEYFYFAVEYDFFYTSCRQRVPANYDVVPRWRFASNNEYLVGAGCWEFYDRV